MPTTRRQAAIAEGRISPDKKTNLRTSAEPSSSPGKKHSATSTRKPKAEVAADEQHDSSSKDTDTKDMKSTGPGDGIATDEPPKKKQKTVRPAKQAGGLYKPGTIERGHIYFFYRPRVQLEEAHSIDDIKNFHMLLVPRPPDFAQSSPDTVNDHGSAKQDLVEIADAEMKVLAPGADAVPAPAASHTRKKFHRLITVGKKRLPDPEEASASGGKRRETFWASVTAVGDDLDNLEAGLGAKSYETKTRGTRHEEPARLVARGGYALVNADAAVPSQRETHLGYHVSHPTPAALSDVQRELGIYSASSFVVQVKNPHAPATGPMAPRGTQAAAYPEWLMRGVFSAGEGDEGPTRGREKYGLRFASCETPELLDYKHAQLLLIAARDGEEGLEQSLGEGRGEALTELEEKEGHEPLRKVFEELGLDLDKFPVESLEGSWI